LYKLLGRLLVDWIGVSEGRNANGPDGDGWGCHSTFLFVLLLIPIQTEFLGGVKYKSTGVSDSALYIHDLCSTKNNMFFLAIFLRNKRGKKLMFFSYFHQFSRVYLLSYKYILIKVILYIYTYI